jgi:hypothetical protein
LPSVSAIPKPDPTGSHLNSDPDPNTLKTTSTTCTSMNYLGKDTRDLLDNVYLSLHLLPTSELWQKVSLFTDYFSFLKINLTLGRYFQCFVCRAVLDSSCYYMWYTGIIASLDMIFFFVSQQVGTVFPISLPEFMIPPRVQRPFLLPKI